MIKKSASSLKDELSNVLTQVDATAVLNEGGGSFTHNKERAYTPAQKPICCGTSKDFTPFPGFC